MRCIITRHGETIQNAQGISQGQSVGGELTAIGVEQARQLARRLRHEKIDYVYCSDLKRAKDTAAVILRFHPNVPIRYEPAMRERSLGIYEGKPKTEWRKANKEKTDSFRLFKPLAGESHEEMRCRICTFFKTLAERHPNDCILLVGHGGPFTLLYLELHGHPITEELYDQYRPENAALTIGEFSSGKQPRFELFNSTEHLIAAVHPETERNRMVTRDTKHHTWL